MIFLKFDFFSIHQARNAESILKKLRCTNDVKLVIINQVTAKIELSTKTHDDFTHIRQCLNATKKTKYKSVFIAESEQDAFVPFNNLQTTFYTNSLNKDDKRVWIITGDKSIFRKHLEKCLKCIGVMKINRISQKAVTQLDVFHPIHVTWDYLNGGYANNKSIPAAGHSFSDSESMSYLKAPAPNQ